MRLFTSPTSPFARAVRVAAAERGISLELVVANPFGPDTAELIAANPLGRVPALVCGPQAIHDSRVIVRYLDTVGDNAALAGDLGDEVRVSTGHGLMEAALLSRLEQLRDASERSSGFIARQRERILRISGALIPGGDCFSLGDIYVACALEYLDFRHSDIPWRDTNANLASYLAEVATRPSMSATRF